MMPDFLTLPGEPCDCEVTADARYVPCDEHAVIMALVLWS